MGFPKVWKPPAQAMLRRCDGFRFYLRLQVKPTRIVLILCAPAFGKA
jgi:hypothetical protein